MNARAEKCLLAGFHGEFFHFKTLSRIENSRTTLDRMSHVSLVFRKHQMITVLHLKANRVKCQETDVIKLIETKHENNLNISCVMHTKFRCLFFSIHRRRHRAGLWFISHNFLLFRQNVYVVWENKNTENIFTKTFLQLHLCANFDVRWTFCLSFETMCKLNKWDFPTRSKWESFGLLYKQSRVKCRFLVSIWLW